MLNGILRERQPRRVARFEQLLADAETLEVGGRQIAVASLDAIIRSKEIADRPKDREALEELRALRERVRTREPTDQSRDVGNLGFEP